MRRLSESVWGAMLDRSAGDAIRKEDDVNHLDLDGLYAYIKEQYKSKVEYIDLDSMGDGNGNVLGVDITKDIVLFYKPKRGHILLSWSNVKIRMPFFGKLMERFNVQMPNVNRRIITEKDGTCTNKTYIDVIDFFLENMDNMLVESVWGGMLDRSVGDTSRKEEIASYNKYKLCDYLSSNYGDNLNIELDNYHMMDWNYKGDMSDILIDVNDNLSIYVLYNRSKQLDRIVLINRRGKYDFTILDNDFNLSGYKGRFDISDKDGGVSNYTVINLVKVFAENKDKIILSESVWGGMLDRSVGDSVRKEDDINLLDMVGLYEYILSHYELTDNRFEMTYGTANMSITISNNGDEILLTYKTEEVHCFFYLAKYSRLYSELSKKFYIETVEESTHYIISPKDECTNQFFIDVLDCIIENRNTILRKKVVNESVWGGMLDRSVGDSVRKEDKLPGNFSEIKYIDTGDENILWSDRNFVVGDQETFERDEIDFPKGYRYPTEKEAETLAGSWSGCTQKNVDGYIHIKDITFPQGHYFVTEDGRRIEISKSLAGTSIIFCCAGDIEPKSNRHYKIRLVKEKNMNESVWGGMLNRSVGDTKRKEDEIPKDLQEALATYIDMFASIAFTGEYTVGSYPDFRAFVRDVGNAKRLSGLEYDVNDLLQYIEDHWNDVVLPTILNTIDKYNKSIDVAVDTIIDSLKDPEVNESVWGSMLDRSVGDSVRKEDDLTPDDVKYHIKEFVGRIVYYSQYENTVNDYERFSKERWRFYDDKGKAYTEKHIDYVKRNWEKGAKFRIVIENLIKEEEEKIKKLGFEREPGKSVDETLNDWWDSVDDKRDFMDDCDEECYTNPDDMWEDRDWEEKIKMYVDDKNYMGESVWGSMLNRSTGDEKRKEDYLNNLDRDGFYEYLTGRYQPMFVNHKIEKSRYSIMIPMFLGRHASQLSIFDSDENKRSVSLSIHKDDMYDHYGDFKKELELKYKLDFNYVEKGWWEIGITSKDDKIDITLNSSIVELIDYILDTDKQYTNMIERTVTESVWGGLLNRSVGDENRKEDGITQTDMDAIVDSMNEFATRVVWDNEKFSMEKFCKCVRDYLKSNKDINIENIIKYIYNHWIGDIEKDIEGFIEEEEKEKENGMNESVWGGMLDRSVGDSVRKEDEVLTDMEINALNEFTLMYCRRERGNYIQNHIVPPPPSGRKENDYEGLIKYIEDRRDENMSTNVGDYNKIIEYIKKNWDTLDMDTYIKKWICTPSTRGGKKIVECDGVPGGATPANVGGMGAAYFPGPNGEPGSGDLPSPTGIVYQQVAPYTMFLKQTKKKKKKTKKFRKEDEPCVHSPNAKVYDYVDDFREYVDRTYNNIDRRK